MSGWKNAKHRIQAVGVEVDRKGAGIGCEVIAGKMGRQLTPEMVLDPAHILAKLGRPQP